MKFWLVIKGNRYLTGSGSWSRHYVLARRFRTKREAVAVAAQHPGAAPLLDADFDGYPE